MTLHKVFLREEEIKLERAADKERGESGEEIEEKEDGCISFSALRSFLYISDTLI
jgi:hypothetical protein